MRLSAVRIDDGVFFYEGRMSGSLGGRVDFSRFFNFSEGLWYW